MHQFGLAAHPVGRHGARIAARALGDFLFFLGQERHVEEFRAQRLHLFLDGRAHVGGLDDGAQALGRGDRLQAGHAHAHDQYAGRLDGAGRRHQHGHEALVGIRGHQHRLVAGDIRLRRQHVHRLRARDARHGFQREGGQAGRGHGGDIVGVKRVEHADQHSAAGHQGPFPGVRCAHLEHDGAAIGFLGGADLRAGGGIRGVGNRRLQARSRLHDDLMLGCQLLDCLGRGCHPRFTRPCFGRYAYPHDASAN